MSARRFVRTPPRPVKRPVRRPAAATVGVLAAVLLLAALPARAAQWYELYDRGLEAEERGAWSEALDLFVEAERFRAEPAERVRTYGNRFLFSYDPAFHRARCLAELGRFDEARSALAASAAAGVTSAGELTALRTRLTRLETELSQRNRPGRPSSEVPREDGEEPLFGYLGIHSSPQGVRVEIDGRPGGSTPVEAVELTAGTHRVRLVDERPDSDLLPWEQAVEVPSGERVHLDVTLARRSPAGEPASEEGVAETDRGETGGPGAGPGRAAADREGAAGAPSPDQGAAPDLESPAEASVAGVDGAAEPSPGRGAAPPTGSSGPNEPNELGEPSESNEGEPDGASSEPPTGAPWDGSLLRLLRARPKLAAVVGGLLVVLTALGGGLAVMRAGSRRSGGRGGPNTTSAIDRRIGERIGRYRIEEVLGRGGMATTYRARRVGDRKEVALKIPHETGDPTYAERFVREGRLGETLHHPGIVRILEAGQDGRQAFLAMELLPGHTLRELMDSAESPLPVERCLAIVREIAEALDYAHSKGVVHRDLKPENVMVLPDGALRVMDFGVARVEGQPGLTNSQFFFGSPVYAAPELVDPRTIDHRADLYSLGVLLYELLEGEPPFVHESIFKLLEMHQREPLPSPEGLPRPLPPAVWRVVARMLAKAREARYPSAQELLVELKRLLYAASDEGRGEDRASDDSPRARA